MMKLDKLIGDVVLIMIREPKTLAEAGITSERITARVVGYDDIGIWIEHPRCEVTIAEDSEGRPLPPAQIQKLKVQASALLPWSQVSTIIHFPNREGFDFPDPFRIQIGFGKGG